MLYEICFILINISLEYFSKSWITNNPELAQIMAWHQASDQSLSKAMMAWFADTYMWYLASMS